MIITYAANSNAWIVRCGNETSALHPAPAGVRWSDSYELWFTRNPDIADTLRPQCSDRARRAIEAMRRVRTPTDTGGTRAATRVEDLFYAAGWSTWARVERVADGVVSPIGEVPLRGPLELLARHFGRLIVERLGPCELHWLSSINETVDEADPTDPWVAKWHAASEAERIDLDQRAFEIAVQTVLHGNTNTAVSIASQLHYLRSLVPSRPRNARKEYAKHRARERASAYQMQHFAEPAERGNGTQGEAVPEEYHPECTSPSRGKLRKSATTIHYLYPPLRDYRWWKGW